MPSTLRRVWPVRPCGAGATAPAELAQFFFSKTFVLSAAPSAGTVSVSADDFAEVRVNGVVVGSVGSISDLSLSGLAQGSLTAFDITSLLVAGTNTITIRGRNGPGSFGGCTNCTYAQHPAGVVFGGSITVAGCGLHRVHGHISTVPSGHFDSIANHVHHGQHGHTVTMCSPPHHGPFHMTPETEEQSVLSASGPPDSLDFVVAVNQDGAIGVARHGTVLQLFRSARGLFIGDQHDRPSEVFTPPVSGVPLFQTTTLPQVRIGGTAAEVLFSGLAPGLTGVWQINVVVPEHVAGRKVPVTISYEGDDLKSIDVAVE